MLVRDAEHVIERDADNQHERAEQPERPPVSTWRRL
jgi:hypothetical protein